MGLLMQGYAPVAVDHRTPDARFPVHLVDIACHIVKAFRPQEEPVPGIDRSPGHPQMVIQLGMGILR